MPEKSYDRSTQDMGNILALEHVNVTVPDQELAHLFYVTGLGFTRDPYMDFGLANMWINVGSQQFHLPRSEPQVLRGRIGVVVPDLDVVRSRLARLERRLGERLTGTAFAWHDENGQLEVTCPWGNRLVLHEPAPEFGDITLGIPWVELWVAPGCAAGIARFYREILDAPAEIDALAGNQVRAQVRIGRSQELRFVETDAAIAAYDGYHVAIYLVNFSGPYAALRERGLITMETNQSEYRFQDIVDLEDGRVLATIEHEVRSLFHPMFDRVLVNRNAAQSFGKYQTGHDAYVGITHGGRG